jgi:hypothetical protein
MEQVPLEERENHLAIVCGDFNVNSIPESEGMKQMILNANPLNSSFIE